MLANAFLIAALRCGRLGPDFDQAKAKRLRQQEARAQNLARDFEAWALRDPGSDARMEKTAAMMDLETLAAEVGIAVLTEAPESIR